MNVVFIGFCFFRSFRQGWIAYYNKSSGPKFTEEQVRIADQIPEVLDECHPIFTKANCFEAFKAGVWLLRYAAPSSIRMATFNLLACEYFFPMV